jgi:hypothetical protein
MFRVYWVNHNYFAQDTFPTVDEALDYARSKGFDATVWRGQGTSIEDMVAAWSTFGGVRRY